MEPLTKKSDLSLAQRRLVELLQTLNFGRIESLRVSRGEPDFEPPPRVIHKLKMGGDNGPRPELSLDDFRLNHQTIELLETIAQVGDGEILGLEIKNGVAFSVELHHQGAQK